MYIKTVGVFSIGELPLDIQDKVIMREIESLQEIWDSAGLEDLLREELIEKGYTNPQITYSGFYSQGDGLSFTAGLDLEKLGQRLGFVPVEDWSGCIERTTNQYCHRRTVRLDIQGHGVTEAIDKINSEIDELCVDLYRRLMVDYEFCASKESAVDSLVANAVHFLSDGTIFDEKWSISTE